MDGIDVDLIDQHYEEIGWTLQKYCWNGEGNGVFIYSKRHLRRRGEIRAICGAKPSILEGGNWIGECERCNAIARKELA